MKKHVTILGAGISGLSLRYFLSKRFADLNITVLEKSDRLGGLVCSQKTGGFFFEKGPRTFKASKNHVVLDLIRELGLEKEILIAQAKRRFILKDQKLQPIAPLMRKALPTFLSEWKREVGAPDETIFEFVSRRFNASVAETFFDPLVTGIFAGDMRKLSILSCFPELKALEQKYGSISRGLFSKKKRRSYPKKMKSSSLFTMREGLSSLTQALVKQGRGEIHLGQAVETLDLDADHVFCALSPSGAEELTMKCDPMLHAFFETLPRESLTAVQLGFHAKFLEKKGFGYLIPSSENEKVLGVIFDSEVFPQQNRRVEETRLTVMVRSDEPLKDALFAVRKHLGIEMDPSWSQVNHYDHAIPQFLVGHEKRKQTFLEAATERFPNVTFLGNYLDGVSINHCVKQAKQAAEGLILDR